MPKPRKGTNSSTSSARSPIPAQRRRSHPRTASAMTAPARATRTYSTSLWTVLPPSMRPDTLEETLPPSEPIPPNSSSK